MLAGQRILTVDSSLASGCGQGHEPEEIASNKLLLTFLVLARKKKIWSKEGLHSLKKTSIEWITVVSDK